MKRDGLTMHGAASGRPWSNLSYKGKRCSRLRRSKGVNAHYCCAGVAQKREERSHHVTIRLYGDGPNSKALLDTVIVREIENIATADIMAVSDDEEGAKAGEEFLR
ncbi:hypothetical protein P154DRAFT_15383 [Amniculicola lignicola CBS 123094]|uniref:Uncharacterized protein n=1 Tax=Amniculicola lignicola CBS 123094 TaxID=1392246 RepID=A0A6A5X5F9_9PLEO|nr:hypothetical protein P154DRAFT_15383 [Amniculicola lignicola CBS 123094]